MSDDKIIFPNIKPLIGDAKYHGLFDFYKCLGADVDGDCISAIDIIKHLAAKYYSSNGREDD